MDKIRKNAGPILYIIVAVTAVWFFFWFAAVYHN